MATIQEMRESLSAKVREAQNLLANKGDSVWTEDDQKKYDALIVDCDRIKDQIDRTQKLLDLEAENHFSDAKTKKETGAKSDANGFEIFVRRGFSRLSDAEFAAVRNTMSTTTDSQGGYTVSESVARSVIESVNAYGTMRRISAHVTTASGSPMNFPTSDANEEGEIVKENTQAADADITFGTRAINVYKFSSKVVTVPFELLQDSEVDIVDLVLRRCGMRIGRAQDHFFTTGTGSEQPNGIVTAAKVGVTGQVGKTSEITYENLAALIESIDDGYLRGPKRASFMMSQAARLAVRSMKDTSGRPIWTPSYDAGITEGLAGTLMGYEVHVNNFMDPLGANKIPVAFGLFNPSYLIRDVMDVQIFRFDDSAFIRKGQIGFMAWARAGGNLLALDAVKTLKMAAS